jgi:amidohydrolase
MSIARARLDEEVDALRTQLIGLADRLHAHPELAFEEHKAAAWISEQLVAEGHQVERALGGVATAFRARIGTGAPHIAILAEYDALPEIGHACGHNLIAAGALGGFLALARVLRQLPAPLPGRIDLIGTPAEEGGGGKIRLLEAGVFQGVDAAMMYHPYDRDLLTNPALATTKLVFSFCGAPAHAAIAPWDGQSALTACLETFRLIDAQRVHFRDGVRVHGIVTNGGQAVNIIPERAECVFQLRAPELTELRRIRAIAERCARGAALACGAQVQITERQGYQSLRNNLTLAARFGAALAELGRPARVTDPSAGAGSTDMGDVSQVVPAIHPYLAICDQGHALCHQHAFAACAGSARGHDTALVAAKALARTAADLLEDAALVAAVRAEFEGDAVRDR